MTTKATVPPWQAFTQVGVLAAVLLYGLVLRPLALDQQPLPLEVLFPLVAAFVVAQLRLAGRSWQEIERGIVQRMAHGVPGFFVLFAVGILIGSWIACGTIPMLVHVGVRLIDPRWLYLLAFVVPAVFSTLTGTSWGSAGTVGVVIMGVAGSVGGDLGVTAGAVIGGAYFGDKLSPLSDTTNMAALGADVPLFDHVRSMLWTTVPSALIAVVVFTTVGLVSPPAGSGAVAGTAEFLAGLERLFTFHWSLLLPPLVVLIGSLRRAPAIPVLGLGILLAAVLAVFVQGFDLDAVGAALTNGFRLDLLPAAGEVPDAVRTLVERGGLYSMSQAVFVAFLVFFCVGAMDCIEALPTVVDALFRFVRGPAANVLAALLAALLTNALTCNQYATSFIVGDAFRRRFDGLGVPRRVLSRSIEDTGTMIESLVPWHPTALFMVATLGVGVADYWRWQVLTLANLVVAPLLALTGVGCGYPRRR
ncbi:MAG: sodium:proton antiporter [Planctomycetes bacterium]|nr:sodium:proton antiporter [Planctomycetota bacterium]